MSEEPLLWSLQNNKWSCSVVSDCSLPRSSVHMIFQARTLEWVAISFSRGSSQLKDRTRVSHIVGRRLTVWATREVHILLSTAPGYKLITWFNSPDDNPPQSGFYWRSFPVSIKQLKIFYQHYFKNHLYKQFTKGHRCCRVIFKIS